VKICKKCQLWKVFQILFSTFTKIPRFFLTLYLFLSHGKQFWGLFLNLGNLPRGACMLVSKLLRATPWLAIVGGVPCFHVCGYNPVRAGAVRSCHARCPSAGPPPVAPHAHVCASPSPAIADCHPLVRPSWPRIVPFFIKSHVVSPPRRPPAPAHHSLLSSPPSAQVAVHQHQSSYL
jgi:hypothetical protein